MFSSIVQISLILFSIYGLAIASGIVSEKSGVLNISINGTMLFGALFSVFGHIMFKQYGPKANGSVMVDFASIILGGIGGILISFLQSVATLKFKGNSVIIGTSINILSPIFVLVLAAAFMKQNKGFINQQGAFGVAVNSASGFNYWNIFWFFLVVLIIVGLTIFYRKTKYGLRLETLGDNPLASELSGINVIKYRFIAISLSGLLAGMAGGLVLINQSGSLYTSIGGIGFIALCLIAMTGWKLYILPIVVFFVSVIFALVNYYSLQESIPKEAFEIIPFVVPFILLPIFSKKVKSPRALGKNYERNGRGND